MDRSFPRRTFVLVLLGVIALQLAWAVVVPPFDAIDEHDHAFKAAAVARGDWSGTHERVEVGRGELVAVPEDIVTAARPACEALSYTRRDDCNPTRRLSDGRVLVGSSAARYHPTVYVVVGTAARPFEGATALYAMRAAAALWCAVLVALAFAVVARGSRTWWPLATCVLALTPTATYTMSIAAPNGVEMASGLLLWCVLLFGARDGEPAPAWVVAAGTVAAVLLATSRALGPLWLLAIVATAAVALGLPVALATARQRRLRLPVAVTGLAVAAGAWWTLAAGTNRPSAESGPTFPGSPWPKMASNWLVWILQQVAAIPRRGDMVPVVVYVVALALWTVLLVLCLLRAPARVRLALVLVFASVTVLSVAGTVMSYAELGYAWQGRYAWPYVVGWLVLAGATLDRSPVAAGRAALGRGVAALALLLGAAVSALSVLALERRVGAYAGWQPSPALVAALCVLAAALVWAGTRPDPRTSPFACGTPPPRPSLDRPRLR